TEGMRTPVYLALLEYPNRTRPAHSRPCQKTEVFAKFSEVQKKRRELEEFVAQSKRRLRQKIQKTEHASLETVDQRASLLHAKKWLAEASEHTNTWEQ